PILLIKKLSSSIRIYIDYHSRGINNTILKIYYPLLLIKRILNAIYKVKIFTKLNIFIAFNRIRIYERYK
ncbi:hypothetical protein NEUTE2DRAFT_58625, partial [Neurospora tetrasperma FGSC 2509]